MCRCMDPAVFGHAECALTPPTTLRDYAWRRLPDLADPSPRPEPVQRHAALAAWLRAYGAATP